MVREDPDLSCLWDKWALVDPPNRPRALKNWVRRGMNIGVNVIAYATGRELLNKIDRRDQTPKDGANDRIERGFLQVAKIVHDGAWDVAPRALRNLLMHLNRTVGRTASTKQRNLTADDPNIFKYPMLYMHGRNRFRMGRAEQEQLRKYLAERGGLLFADACCGSKHFDQSFRDLVQQVFPDKKFQQIPAGHELFTTKIGFDLKQVRRRAPETSNKDVALKTDERVVEPFLEGIEIDGRYVVIYSKYDISCALERQASVACAGYVEEDAMKIAINVVLYSMLQDVSSIEGLKD